MNDKFWVLLGKYWSGQISSGEKAELEQMLLEHPDYWLKTGMMHQLEWQMRPLLTEQKTDEIADKILSKGAADHEDERRIKRRRRQKRIWQLVAACALIIVVAGSLIFIIGKNDQKNKLHWQYATTTDGMRTKFRLADGTQLWLNAGSSLRYPENFDHKTREVYLTGEAYFAVRHDAARPFIIHTTGMQVRVLGTEVDVRAYKDEDYAEASLIKGAVEVIVHQEDKSRTVYLKPNQKVEVRKNKLAIKSIHKDAEDHQDIQAMGSNTIAGGIILKPVTVTKDDIISEIAWKHNTLLFENETLASLAKRLERWYGVTIDIKDSILAKERFTGRADNISVEKLLRILQMAKPFNYSMRDNKIMITN